MDIILPSRQQADAKASPHQHTMSQTQLLANSNSAPYLSCSPQPQPGRQATWSTVEHGVRPQQATPLLFGTYGVSSSPSNHAALLSDKQALEPSMATHASKTPAHKSSWQYKPDHQQAIQNAAHLNTVIASAWASSMLTSMLTNYIIQDGCPHKAGCAAYQYACLVPKLLLCLGEVHSVLLAGY